MRAFLKHLSLIIGVLLIVTSMFLARSTLQEYRRRNGLYWYDVEKSYEYRFDSKAVTRVPVVVDDSGFEWPANAAPCETALLRASLSSHRSGYWFEPGVRISTSGLDPFTQHFERGGHGTRYLNVSPICRAGAAAGDHISISAEHATVRSGSGELLLFRDPVLSGKRLLVLAPHPDDAEIAAFALYRENVSTIVTATVGGYVNRAYTHLVDDPSKTTALLGRLRTWDSISVPIWGGVSPEHSVALGYLGGALETMYAESGSESSEERGATEAVRAYRSMNSSSLLRPGAVSSWESLVADLVYVIERIEPAIIALPHPVLDVSREHRLTSLALLQALAYVEGQDAQLLLYNNHHLYSEYWPYGPADSLMTLPPWFGDINLRSFGSVYSHVVDREAQVDKLLALDAMHDLRAPSRAHRGDPTIRMLRWFRRTADEMWQDPHRYYSYFRRAPRPNELFFVVEPEGRAALQEAALEALSQ
ncbi:MAG: PIG-L family deacetylase [Deltaproteobacteria bacterium]|nr:PIG-L family deacetylase [Deltaproteobacteria bacterium]